MQPEMWQGIDSTVCDGGGRLRHEYRWEEGRIERLQPASGARAMSRVYRSDEPRLAPEAPVGCYTAPDSGLKALGRLTIRFGVHFDPLVMAHDLALEGRLACAEDLVRAAWRLGFKAQALTGLTRERLESLPRPALLRMRDGRYIVLGELKGAHQEMLDADATQPTLHSMDEIAAAWSGEAVLVARRTEASEDRERPEFGFRWFLPSLWRYRSALTQVCLVSLFLQIFTIVTPVFTQVVVDRVLVHNSASTLLLIVVVLAVLGLFEVTLQYLRSYAVSHTGCRLDLELGSRVFNHLLRQPLAYFETTAVGQIVARMAEITNIRNFFTGQGVTSVLDVLFTIVLLGIMALYSVELTCFSLLFVFVYVIVQTVLRPVIREMMKHRFHTGAENQQFLVETLVGSQTIKAAALEPLVQLRFDQQLGRYVKTSFEAAALVALSQSLMQYVSRLSTAVLLYLGARAVMAKDMTIGEMIAFTMMSGQLSAPILRLSQLWQEFQQFNVSMARLGDIMKSPVEADASTMAELPPMKGAISFRNVCFRYNMEGPDVLHDISLEIGAGEVIGVVGLSGSGKSTLAKLVQKLYTPQRGHIAIDGIDIAMIHPAWIRRQMGVVSQESVLFDRSIHENIAFADPYATREQVMELARLAGADEFIRKLPRGYDTPVIERGSNLSGGQRQRIAIARSLVRNPRVLILDEATSAVDCESELTIRRSLKAISRGRTVIIIAHRLSTVCECDRIVGIADGNIVEEGTHEMLMHKQGGLYRRLWSLQAGLTAE